MGGWVQLITETIVATGLFALGQVLGADQLMPVSFAKWAKGLEREGKRYVAIIFVVLVSLCGYSSSVTMLEMLNMLICVH
jgi:hypothetical protein